LTIATYLWDTVDNTTHAAPIQARCTDPDLALWQWLVVLDLHK
jgi:hypothetical protein